MNFNIQYNNNANCILKTTLIDSIGVFLGYKKYKVYTNFACFFLLKIGYLTARREDVGNYLSSSSKKNKKNTM